MTTTININNLKTNPFLEKYGINKITDFEFTQLQKFNIPPGQVIVTEDNSVLYGWDEVQYALKLKIKELEVVILEGIDEDHTIQVVCLKNMRKKLTRYQLAELIHELRDYLDHNPAGIQWQAEIPGNNVVEKIAFLLGYSYGMTTQLQRLYRDNPDALEKIDNGELTFTEAMASLKADNDGSDNPGSITSEKKSKAKRFAGEKSMVECEKVIGITVRYFSGRTIEIDTVDGKIAATAFGHELNDLEYGGGLLHLNDNSEVHCFTSGTGKQVVELIMRNIDNQAA